jgi:ethanolamine transporter EutH
LTLNGVVQGGTSNILNILVSLLLLAMLLLPLLLLLLLWLLLTKVLDRFHNHLVSVFQTFFSLSQLLIKNKLACSSLEHLSVQTNVPCWLEHSFD